jgi:RNA methyltransferase, TrmH family
VEGQTLVGEALDAGVAVEAVFVPAGATVPAVAARAAAAGVPVLELAPGVLERVAGTVTPQPVLAVAHRPAAGPAVLDDPAADLVLVLAGVADPGNAGTLLRTAEAAGAAAVVVAAGSVDPFGPKCVRASAGAVFRVPVVEVGDPGEALDRLAARGVRRLATVVAGGRPYDEVDLTGPVAVVLGNEAHGLDPAVAAGVDEAVTIPMAGRAESLNVGMAGAVLCFEVVRQRRRAGR